MNSIPFLLADCAFHTWSLMCLFAGRVFKISQSCFLTLGAAEVEVRVQRLKFRPEQLYSFNDFCY